MAVTGVPATVGQRLLWMMNHYRATREYGAFNCPVLCRIRGTLDHHRLGRALNALSARHESLRTTFAGRGRALVQQVHPPTELPVQWRDVRDAAVPLPVAESEIAAELRRRIDVTQSPVRVTAWHLSDTERRLCLNLHHLATDAWSTGILFQELRQLYASDGAPSGLPPVRWQYQQFARWQEEQLAHDGFARQRAYWLGQLDGAQLARPPRRAGAATSTSPPTGVASTELSPESAQRLRDLAKRHRTTLFTVLLAGYFAQLHRATGQRDLAVASLFANRSRPETQETVGFLTNMVMLRARDAGADLGGLLRATHATTVRAFAHQEQPFQLLPPHLIDTGDMRADDVVFQVVMDAEQAAPGTDPRFELLVPEGIGSRFSFELVVVPQRAGLRPMLFYRQDWYDDDWAASFVADYGELLDRLPATLG